MKARQRVIGIVAALVVGAASPVFASESAGARDSIIDKVGDWFATVGKSDVDKQIILADRRTKRIMRHTQHELEESNQKAREEIGAAAGK